MEIVCKHRCAHCPRILTYDMGSVNSFVRRSYFGMIASMCIRVILRRLFMDAAESLCIRNRLKAIATTRGHSSLWETQNQSRWIYSSYVYPLLLRVVGRIKIIIMHSLSYLIYHLGLPQNSKASGFRAHISVIPCTMLTVLLGTFQRLRLSHSKQLLRSTTQNVSR